MAEAEHKEASALSEEAQRFWLARTALRNYLVAKDELHWRAQNLYKKERRLRQGCGGTPWHRGLSELCR